MADDTKPAPAAGPTAEEIAAAVKEYEATTDRVKVLGKYPWLADILNNPK